MIKFLYNKIFIYLYVKFFTRKKWSTDNLPEIEPPILYSKL